jgi:hypothetical protein
MASRGVAGQGTGRRPTGAGGGSITWQYGRAVSGGFQHLPAVSLREERPAVPGAAILIMPGSWVRVPPLLSPQAPASPSDSGFFSACFPSVSVAEVPPEVPARPHFSWSRLARSPPNGPAPGSLVQTSRKPARPLPRPYARAGAPPAQAASPRAPSARPSGVCCRAAWCGSPKAHRRSRSQSPASTTGPRPGTDAHRAARSASGRPRGHPQGRVLRKPSASWTQGGRAD